MIQKTIGIVGGGQLGRMLTLSAHQMGYKVVVVDPVENCPAYQVGATQIKADLKDSNAIKKLAKSSDVITLEIEHVDVDTLEELANSGFPVHPSPTTVKIINDKLLQKQFLQKSKIPVAPFVGIDNEADARKALKQFNGKMLIKTRQGGYDGRGNIVVDSPSKIKQALKQFAGQPVYAEEYIPFSKELAAMVARTTNGEIKLYPVVETVHKRNICIEVLVPADVNDKTTKKAEAVVKKVAKNLNGAGVFGIELFLTKKGSIIVNEIAPRVHNSGHYTTEANITSQFEQHIRAVLGLPLGSTELVVNNAAMVNILGERDGPTAVTGLDKSLKIPNVKVHIYGKSPTKIDRKMGHITATGKTLQSAKLKANKARSNLSV